MKKIERVLEYHEIEELLRDIKGYSNKEAAGLFLCILENQLKPYYKKLEFAFPNIFECISTPLFASLEELTNKGKLKKKKTLVKAYCDRRIELCEENVRLRDMCNRMARMTEGNFTIYEKGGLKYLY